MTSPLGLAALTVLDVDPVGQVDLAEAHGFDTVGFRLLPAAPGTPAYPLHADAAARREVRARLDDSHVALFDIEIVRLTEDFDLDAHRPLLETGAQLQARAVLVAGNDADRGRLSASYAAFAAACAEHGLVASLEFMPWTAVPDARSALGIVEQADGPGRSILVDSLHVARSSTTLEDLAAIPTEWLHYGQVCDASVPAPTATDELIRQAREERLPPGEGGIDLRSLWATMPEDTPVSIELPNEPRRRAVGTGAWLDHLVATTREVLTA